MKRWKVWNRDLVANGGQVEPRFPERVQGLDLLAVTYVTPAHGDDRECRQVRVQLSEHGAVTVTHSTTDAPTADDGAVRPTTTIEHYIPGWEESDEWEADES